MASPTRRRFLTATAAPFLLSAQSRRDRPNVLFIAIDDLNNWIGCLNGHPDVKTPNLDRFASEGVLFTNAHCAAPLCNPSRAALLTGIPPADSGCYDNRQPFRKTAAGRNAVTLPQQFQASGYRVVGSGKIFHGGFPDPVSWQEYWPSQTRNKPSDPVPERRPANGIPNTAQFDWGPLDVADSAMGDWQVTDWIVRELERKQDRPFFLGYGNFRPHLPWYVPRKYFDMYPEDKVTLPRVNEHDLDDIPAVGRTFAKPEGDHRKVIEHKQWRNAVRSYLASITFADACVGRVLDAFRASRYTRDTAVVLWSDHGWHLGQKLHWRKFTLWEEATHNVLMVSAPWVTKPGGRCARTVSLMDVSPTVTELCGLPSRKTGGASLVPLLKNHAAPWDQPAISTYLRGNHSVRSERWRYIRYHDATEELYDHQADELEWTNLASKPEYEPVKRELARWLPKTDAPDGPREVGLPDDGDF